jgi:ATP-dependent helicase Lhr and Lhr-like helicase
METMQPSSPDPNSLAWAHPIVQEWFVRKFGSATEPQEAGWPRIVSGETTLISAPTGSGKTLAAFLACIDRLVRKAIAGELQDRTEVLYISPLKALGNDIQKNLEAPLAEILTLAAGRGLLRNAQTQLPGIDSTQQDAIIRTAVRTGDTLAHERRAMLKRPPHILVTTPESLYILLTAERSRAILKTVETVIVDEIHAVAGSKRGSHLALSLERLEALTDGTPVRIGLSATQKPLDQIAHFLAGSDRPMPAIVNIGHHRKLDLAIEVGGQELGPVASNEMWDELYDRIAQLAQEHRSTLVFVNTRRLVERVSHNLAERMGEDQVAAHHGSLSRKLRLAAEKKLKAGEVRVLVATASLELGIDIGAVDLVCVLGSPRSIAVALQRVGRAGHWRGAVPKGRIFAMTRDELMECAALVRGIRHGELDRILMPNSPLDVLAQQIVAICAAEDFREDALFDLVRRAWPYRDLTLREFDETLEMLSEGIASSRGRYGTYLHRDRVNGMVRARRGSRMQAILNGGAIPENALYTVIAQPEGTVVGTVDEDFAVESLRGDIILLGNTSWRIHRVESNSGRLLVEDAHGAAPSVPFWRGEAPSRTAELSAEVAALRNEISERVPGKAPASLDTKAPAFRETVDWLREECGLDVPGAEQAIQHVLMGRAVLGSVPTQKTVIAERFFDEAGGMQLVIHAPFGGRINKAWGLALRKRFCRSFNFELQASATDDGLNIALAEQHSFPLADVFNFLSADSVQPVLEQAALASPIFQTRWRWDAGRSLALLRFSGGKKVPPPILRMRADDLLASVFPQVAACQENVEGDIAIPDHPLVREVMKDVLTEAMDLEGLQQVLRDIESGAIRTVAVDTPVPSQFSHEILNANPYAYLDDAPLEERRARAVEMRRVLPASVLEEVGALDPAAIAEVRADAWPDVRDADELHDALLTLVALPDNMASAAAPDIETLHATSLPEQSLAESQEWIGYMQRLIADRRAGIAIVNGRRFWMAAERAKAFAALYPAAPFEVAPGAVNGEAPSQDEALLQMVTGWMQHIGPATAPGLGGRLGLPASEIHKALLRMEAAGSILRGKFTSNGNASPSIPSPNGVQPRIVAEPIAQEFCERRLLARIHRLTLGRLRKQIQPVTAATFMRWLLQWQHVAPGSQLSGERGLLEILRQMQGFEIPANAWERQVLARRLRDYDPKLLDQLCLTGAVGWGRLSPHPATLDTHVDTGDPAAAPKGVRRVVPTKVAPITLFIRDEAEWMGHHHGRRLTPPDDGRGLSPVARDVLAFLRQRGASFFADIVRGAGKLKSEIETGLWELVAAGLVTADGFDNLRSLIDPKRRAGQGSGKATRPRHSAGRWALLYEVEAADHEHALEATCRMLLERYGVVFRELVARETILRRWRELLIGFRRLEDRGDIRGGRFVDGFLGEQFALPVAVESLRALRSRPSLPQAPSSETPGGESITVSAADPLNLVGIIVPGERVPAISGRFVSFRDGIAVPEEDRGDVLEAAGIG